MKNNESEVKSDPEEPTNGNDQQPATERSNTKGRGISDKLRKKLKKLKKEDPNIYPIF